MPGPALKIIRMINEDWGKELSKMQQKVVVKSSKVFNENGNSLSIEWILPAFNAKRMDFDFELWKMVKAQTRVQCFEEIHISSIERIENDFSLKDKKGNIFTTKLLLAADGANSFLAKQLIGFRLCRKHHSAAGRAYVEGVTQLEEKVNLLFLFKKVLPGYFWIFPIGENSANIGFGMLSAEISMHKSL